MVRIAGVAAREKGAGEGIGWFAAKRDDVPDGCARGIEVEMFLAGMRSLARGMFRLTLRVSTARLLMVIGYRLLVIEGGLRGGAGEWCLARRLAQNKKKRQFHLPVCIRILCTFAASF